MRLSDNSREMRFQAENITCLGCAEDMENILRGTRGILEASVNYKDETVHIRYDPAILDRKQVFVAVRRLGYPLRLLPESK